MAMTVEAPSPATRERWNLATRIAFRFCFACFTLYSLSNQIVGGLLLIPVVGLYRLGTLWPLRQITLWTATHVFRITRTVGYAPTGSGDKTFDWVQLFCLLNIAAAVTILWSVLDRRRENYVVFHKWFRLFLRLALAGQMLSYGFSKLVPMQMPFPPLTRLVEPFGNFSPMGVLWWSVGSSRPYEIFTGCAETLGGLLLFTPRTATFGALICLADMIQVFTLNMTYDVPVKLLSFHLVLFSLFLLAPEARRIAGVFFFSDRATGPSTQPPLFRSVRANRVAVILQIAFGLYLVGMHINGDITRWYSSGGGRPKPSLYGIWNVEQMSIGGQVRSPLLNDYGRWRRVIFDSTAFSSFQRMDDTFANYSSSINDKDQILTLTKPADKDWKATFAFRRPALDQLVLDGAMDGQKVQMQLKLFDRDKLTLVNRGFHWINDVPFQR